MRMLNPGACKYTRVRHIPAEPELCRLDAWGHSIVWDANNMRVAELDGEETSFTESFIPQFIPQPFFSGTSLCLNLTNGCPLSCAYCFGKYAYKDTEAKTMSFETAKLAVDTLLSAENVRISYFGGEPLLCWDLIKEVTSYVMRTKGGTKHFHISTNGVLLTDEMMPLLESSNFSLIVSIDGPQSVHDALRKFQNGKGSYEKVVEALQRVGMTGALRNQTTARATYTPDHCEIFERTKFLNEEVLYTGMCNKVSVEPCSLSEAACSQLEISLFVSPEKNSDLLAHIHEEVHKIAQWFVQEIRAKKLPSLHILEHTLRVLTIWGYKERECSTGLGVVTVDADGDLYACHRAGPSGIGNLRAGLDESKRALWCYPQFYHREPCRSCNIRLLCGGGCRLMSLEQIGNIRLASAENCFFTNLWFKAAVWLLAELGPQVIADYLAWRDRPMTDQLHYMGLKAYRCPLCGMGLDSQEDLRRHLSEAKH